MSARPDYFALAAEQAQAREAARRAESEAGLPLFRSHPRHHTHDPHTSVEAGIQAGPRAEVIRQRVKARLALHPDGLTAEEIESIEGWQYLDAARRLTELLADGEVERVKQPDGKLLTRTTRRGGKACVWRLPT